MSSLPSISAVPFPSQFHESPEEIEEREKEAAAARRAEAERARAVRWRLVAGILLSRANGKGRSLSRKAGGNSSPVRTSSGRPSSPASGLSAAQKANVVEGTMGKTYVRSGLSRVVGVEA